MKKTRKLRIDIVDFVYNHSVKNEFEIDVYMDHVVILGHTIHRPSRISRYRWMQFWEDNRWTG